MIDVQLIINGQMFPVHYRYLLAIAENLPDDEEASRELAKALAFLGVPSITKTLIESSGSLLSQQDLDEFWAIEDLDIRRDLTAKHGFIEKLTDAQAQDILDLDDRKMFESIAEKAFWLYFSRWEIHKRLYDVIPDAILNHIVNSRYPGVRQTLAGQFGLPLKFRPSFRECVEFGFDVKKVFSTIQPEDIELLSTEPMGPLQYIAFRIQYIEDETARQGVLDLLCVHPDPSVRLALAKNSDAPRLADALRLALERLLEDEEPDVQQAARATLRDMDRYSANDQGDG